MNKNILYLSIAVIVGLFAGWLIFGNSTENSNAKTSSSHEHNKAESSNQMYTCSMHPQIMQPEPGNCPICGMDLIPAESSGEGLAMNEIRMTKNAMALANIQTTIVGNVESNANDGMISLSGKIAANEENNSVQPSYFAGRIERLNVNFEGQEVNRGQLLATIYSPNLVAAQQELITAASLKESQPALYNAVKNKLKNWKLSETQINAIESSGKVTENFPVYATVSGTVIEVMAAEGDYLNQGQPIAKLSNLNSVWAEFDAYENQISSLKKGQKIKITANAIPNRDFDATILFIDPMLNNSTRTITVRATLENAKDVFKPGMFVTGKIKSDAIMGTETLSIPSSAVMWTGERSLVYVKTKPDVPVFEMRSVTLGNRSGENYTIVDGLTNGEEIVTNGAFTVDAAAQLQGKKSMMNTSKPSGNGEKMINMDMNISEAIQEKLEKALPSYLKLKDAFVASDSDNVSKLARSFSDDLNSINSEDLKEMEQAHLSKIKELLNLIAKSNKIENQRQSFVMLNQNFIPMIKAVKNMKQSLYVQNCPMANQNQGASWMSREEAVKNPYFGDAMLTCGSVTDTIAK